MKTNFLTILEIQILIDAVGAMPPPVDSVTEHRREEIKRKLHCLLEEIESILSEGEVH